MGKSSNCALVYPRTSALFTQRGTPYGIQSLRLGTLRVQLYFSSVWAKHRLAIFSPAEGGQPLLFCRLKWCARHWASSSVGARAKSRDRMGLFGKGSMRSTTAVDHYRGQTRATPAPPTPPIARPGGEGLLGSDGQGRGGYHASCGCSGRQHDGRTRKQTPVAR